MAYKRSLVEFDSFPAVFAMETTTLAKLYLIEAIYRAHAFKHEPEARESSWNSLSLSKLMFTT